MIALCITLLNIALVFGQVIDNFKAGWYYDTDGRKHEGLISYIPNTRAHPYILFKPNLQAEPKKVKALKMDGFIVDKDTFAIVTNFTVEGIQNPLIKVPVGIAQVLEIGKINLYKCQYVEEYQWNWNNSMNHSRPVYTGENVITTFIVRQANTDRFISVREDQYEFNDQMSHYLQINPDLSARIKSGAYSNRKVQTLIHEFNNWYAQNKQQQ